MSMGGTIPDPFPGTGFLIIPLDHERGCAHRHAKVGNGCIDNGIGPYDTVFPNRHSGQHDDILPKPGVFSNDHGGNSINPLIHDRHLNVLKGVRMVRDMDVAG